MAQAADRRAKQDSSPAERRNLDEEQKRVRMILLEHDSRLCAVQKDIIENTQLTRNLAARLERPLELIEAGASFFNAIERFAAFCSAVIHCVSRWAKRLLPIVLLLSGAIVLLVQLAKYDVSDLIKDAFNHLVK